MYLVKNFIDKFLKVIGEIFGGCDYSIVIYFCKMVQDLMEIDFILKDMVLEFEKKIRMSLNDK